ncbi:MAG: glutamate formimidoyltransferase [Paramuribaculum sp.]|nr:glutamate formimidoyltransferase [Paramuribaculum sp.]
MQKKIIECVPNFSEGRRPEVIEAIADAVRSVSGVKLLDVDPGEATNRTVMTFAGEPEPVMEAAFRAVKRASELIDMRSHKGAHPRMGATDVLPLVPVQGITLEECAQLARQLGRRIADELSIPVYAYEASAFKSERKNLAVCRQGEYEGLAARLGGEDGADFGDRPWDEAVARTGATAVGARNFLIAVNFNLNTTSTRRANAIAFDVREKGRVLRKDGEPMKDAQGNPVMQPGTLPATKAIGWFIEEYGIAQVSMNITDITRTPLHVAFDEVCRAAQARGIRVTGTEIVGIVPRSVLIDAGKYFLAKQQRSCGLPEDEIVDMAVRSMGLAELGAFEPKQKVIEYMLAETAGKSLVELTARNLAYLTASESPAPGGGSVSAYIGALGAALGTMVANLSSHKAGWDARWKEFSDVAEQGQALTDELLRLVDADTEAFNKVMEAIKMPKSTDAEKEARRVAMDKANEYAAEVPLATMQTAMKALPLLEQMAEKGNPASVTDAGVGALAIRTAVEGAGLNVKINAASIADADKRAAICGRVDELNAQTADAVAKIMEIVNSKI